MKMNSKNAVMFGALVLGGGLIFAQMLSAYAATLRMTINHSIVGSYVGSNDLGNPTQQLSNNNQQPILLGNGTGDNQANVLFTDQRTLGASSTEELDLFGSLTDTFGTTISLTTVKVIKVCAAADNTNNVNVGPGIASGAKAFVGPFSSVTAYSGVKPGGCQVMVAPKTGWAVTATTADALGIGNSSSGSGVTYNITVIGTQ